MASIKFKWDSSELDLRLSQLPLKLRDRVEATVDLGARKGEIRMKERAPWTQTGLANRWGRVSTGLARDNLYAKAKHDYAGPIAKHSIEFGNALPRAKWLEIAMSGRFQIIMPTVKAVGDAVMLSLNGLLEEIDAAPVVEINAPELGEPGTSQGPERIAERDVSRPFGSVRRVVSEVFRRSPNIIRRIAWRRR